MMWSLNRNPHGDKSEPPTVSGSSADEAHVGNTEQKEPSLRSTFWVIPFP